jgi:N-acetylmuramic acid 6-phosphate etherase
VGPEILTGSTRLKAGTATKMVLNMLTTTAFVLSGKVYKNLMIDVKPFNKKLLARQKRILMTLFSDLNEEAAQALLQQSGQNVKTAIVMHTCNLSYEKADALLRQNRGDFKRTIACAEQDQLLKAKN